MATQAPIPPKKQQTRKERQKVTAMPVDDQIRLRAYELYIQRNGESGSEIDDWLQAEAEFNGQGRA
jgi:hypothetical protein